MKLETAAPDKPSIEMYTPDIKGLPDAAVSPTIDDIGALDNASELLLRLNSEFANYVPPSYQMPQITLKLTGDPEYFPLGVKHRYTRKAEK